MTISEIALGELNGLVFTTAEKWEADEFISTWHYSGKLNKVIVQAFSMREPGGLFGDRGPIVACVAYGHPVRANTKQPGMIELVRLARMEDPPEGLRLSYMVAASLRWLAENTEHKIVMSYADSKQDHHGGIYQACNFIYAGKGAKDTVYKDPKTGELFDRKSLFDIHGTSAHREMVGLGLKRVTTGTKYLYLYPLVKGRKAREKMVRYYGFEPQRYPKPDTPGGLG